MTQPTRTPATAPLGPHRRTSTRIPTRVARLTIAVLVASGVLGVLAGTALAAPTMHGTFSTPLKQGTITYTAQPRT